MKHEITIKVAVETPDGILEPSKATMISNLSRRIEQARYSREFTSVAVTNVTVNGSSFGEDETTANVESIETVVSNFAHDLIESLRQQQ